MKTLFFFIVLILCTYISLLGQILDPIKIIEAKNHNILDAEFLPDGNSIVIHSGESKSFYNNIDIYNFHDSKNIFSWQGIFYNFDVSPDSKNIVCGGKYFVLNNITTKSYSAEIENGENSPRQVFFNQDGTLLYAIYINSLYNNDQISSFKIGQEWWKKPVEKIRRSKESIYPRFKGEISYYFDKGKELIITNSGNTISIYDISKNLLLDSSNCIFRQIFSVDKSPLSGAFESNLSVVVSKNSNNFAITLCKNHRSYIYIYDLQSFKYLSTIEIDYQIKNTCINPNSNILVIEQSGSIKFIDLNSCELISTLPFKLDIKSFNFSPDGTKMLTYKGSENVYGKSNASVFIWDFFQLFAYSLFTSKIDYEIASPKLYQPKGEFETNSDYEIRFKNQKNYKKIILDKYVTYLNDTLKLIADRKIELIKASFKHVALKISKIGTFNSEKESFPVTIENYGEVEIDIPIAEAKSFKDNIAKVKADADKQLENDGKTWKYFNLTFYHPITGSKFILNPDNPQYLDYVSKNTTESGVPRLEAAVKFIEPSGNNLLDGEENAKFEVTIKNTGTATAQNVKINLSTVDNIGFTYDKTKTFTGIAPNQSQTVIFEINADRKLKNKEIPFNFNFSEVRGFNPADVNYIINTQSFKTPLLVVKDVAIKEINGNNNSMIENQENIEVSVLIQNTGQGKAENAKAVFDIADKNIISLTPDKMVQYFGDVNPGESKLLSFNFTVNSIYSGNDVLPIRVVLSEKYSEYGGTFPLKLEMKKVQLTAKNIKVSGQYDQKIEIKDISLLAETDKNIPETGKKNENRFALIIGNEDYNSSQPDLNSEMNVLFAENDARIFKEYTSKTLGVPEENITLLINAKEATMRRALEKMNNISQKSNGNAELIVYYAGHGLPDENIKEPYIIPVDVSGTNFKEGGIKLTDVYKKLTEYPSKKITVFIDACFSGGARDQGLLSARSVRIKPKETALAGNIVVFSASSGEQSSLPYKDKQHGMFTYFLLKKIQETKGEISLKELSSYVKDQVSLQSVNINNKEQTPVVNSGTDTWEKWTLR